MRHLYEYIVEFRDEGSKARTRLADLLDRTRSAYDVHKGKEPRRAFATFVKRYNWLGDPTTKKTYQISQNLARNLPGALMQDYLAHLAIKLCEPYQQLEVFTEQRVPFGRYPLWEEGEVEFASPSERSDIAIGHLLADGEIALPSDPWPRQVIFRLGAGQSIMPLVTINSKIRVSQSEFFDWQGREQLMTKGNPHCLSVQVALRKEMDLSIVEAAQARDKWFLLGSGGERSVTPDPDELARLLETISGHLEDHMV